jgi:hypothetical protein
MIRIFKALGLTLVAVCALGAVMPSGASAAEFTAASTATTNVHEGGTTTGTDLETPVFTVAGEATASNSPGAWGSYSREISRNQVP